MARTHEIFVRAGLKSFKSSEKTLLQTEIIGFSDAFVEMPQVHGIQFYINI